MQATRRATVGEGREAAAHADLTKKTAFRTLSFYLWALYILYFLCFFLSFLDAIVRKPRISSHFLRTLRNLHFLPRMQDFSSAAIHSPSDPPTSTPRTAFTANVIRKNYEVNAHFRKCYESQL